MSLPSEPITRKEQYLAKAAGQAVEIPAEPITREEAYLDAIAKGSGGGGGTSDYSQLTNKPQINGTTLTGNKSASDLSLASTSDLAGKVDKVEGKGLSTNDYTDADKAIVGGVTAALAGKQDALTAGANINMTGDVVKAGVVEVVEPDMTVYGNSTESGSKTYTIETTGVYEIFYCLSLQSTVSVTLPNDANVLFESDLTVSSHPVKHIVAELHEGDTVTIAQTPSQWNAVVSGVLKLDAISVVNVAHTGSVADSTITYTLPNDNKYYLVVGACVGKPTGNNAVDSTSGGTPEITRTLTGSGVRFRSVVVKGSDSPSFSFYGYDGGVASIIAYEIEFEEGNWDYNLVTKNYVDTALSGKQDTLTFDDTPTDNSNNPVKSNGVYDALALKQDKTDNTLQTTSKTVVGAVNELKSGLTTLDNEVNGDATTYPYADVITIPDAIPANVADCKVKIEPVQDLHGYDHPWVGGGYKNLCPYDDITFSVNATWASLTGSSAPSLDDGTSISLKAGTYYISISDSSNISTMQLSLDGNVLVNNIQGAFTLETDGTIKIRLKQISSGNQTEGKIQIEIGTYSTLWTPYTNICPITGHTEVDVQRDGVNLFDKNNINSFGGYIDTVVQKYVSNIQYKSCYIKCEPSTAYTISKVAGKTFRVASSIDAPENGVPFINTEVNHTGTNITITTGSNARYLTVLYWSSANGDTLTPAEIEQTIQIELGSSATDYEPYAGKTYTIALGDTIYGGIVRIDSNGNTVMDVDRAIVEYDGSEDEEWTAAGGSASGWAYSVPVSNIYTNVDNLNIHLYESNLFKFVTSADTWGNYDYFISKNAGVNNLVIGNKAIGSVNDLRSWLSNNHLQVVYLLYTPTTIQLTPQQIQLLKGQNTLTASTGQISVTVNGVSGAIGSVQEQVNEKIAELESEKANKAVKQVSSSLVNVDETFTVNLYDDVQAVTIMLYRYGHVASLTVPSDVFPDLASYNEQYLLVDGASYYVKIGLQYDTTNKTISVKLLQSTISGGTDVAVKIVALQIF